MKRSTKQLLIVLLAIPLVALFQNCSASLNFQTLPDAGVAKSESVGELEVLDFSSSVTEIFSGEQVTFKFRVSGATEVMLDPGYINVTGMTSITIRPSASAQYTLTAKNSSSSLSKSLPISVIAAPAIIYSFTSSSSSITAGQEITLNWNVAEAAQINLDPGNILVTNQSSIKLSPSASTVYVLKAKNSAGHTITRNLSVTVNAAPVPAPQVLTFNSTKDTISTGESVTLSWTTSSATSLTLTPGNIDVTNRTSITMAPQATTTYRLMASNSSGSDFKTKMITVNAAMPVPEIRYFNSASLILYDTESTTLTWESTGATSLRLNPGNIDVTNLTSYTVSPKENTTYVLSAVNSGGQVTKSVSIIYIQPWTLSSTIEFTVGTNSSVDLKLTLPTGLTAGGTFSVSPTGSPLPAGMTLSTNGILNIGSASAGDTDNVIFEYTEPN